MNTKITIEITSILPGVPDARDACVERLSELLLAKEGVDASHLIDGEDNDRLCIHFDPDRLSVGEVRALARRAGAGLHKRYGHLLMKVEAMHASRASAIESRLSRIEGVLEAVVSPDGTLRVEYDREQTDDGAIGEVVAKWDSPSSALVIERDPESKEIDDRAADHSGHDHDHGGIFGRNSELVFACLCGVMLLLGWLIARFSGLADWVSMGFFAGAYLFGGYFTVLEAIEKIRAGKFEIDFLMIFAAVGAAILGVWAEGALLLFLFSIGHSLEGYAMGRAKRAIEALAELAPRVARVRRDSREFEVSVDDLVLGDIVVIKPDERVAADGFVVVGESSVDQAPITGESLPVDKFPVPDPQVAAQDPDNLQPEHRVFAGTINQSGALQIQVTKLASDSTLSRVVTMVSEAETRVSPTQQFTNRFERYFVPTVVGGVLLLMFAPLAIDETFDEAFYRAMAVLVAASPCALAIATPSAVLSGVARAAKGGVLVKGGGPLETLGRLDAIAFDKTGTLTAGKPRVTDTIAAEGVDERDLLRIAIAVENLSNHPLASAVVRDARERLGELQSNGSGAASGQEPANFSEAPSPAEVPSPGTPSTPHNTAAVPIATEMRSITGRGIRAMVEGKLTYIGKAELFDEISAESIPDSVREAAESLERNGRTTMIVRHGDTFLGVMGLMDTPRESARRTISRLRKLGITRMIMISGDNQRVADAVAAQVGLDEARGDLMPADKVAEIKKLRGESGVAMVGDGVNDAPAMASASVGIAMGAAGSDVALETADVALMADNLDHLPLAIGLSRATSRIIRQNLWISLGMVALLVPLTIAGLKIGFAVMLHEGSTLIVVFNALRLLAYTDSSEDE